MAFSQLTRNALARVAAGETPYAAAKAEGLALMTVYNALKKIKENGGEGTGQIKEKKKTVMNRAVATINLTKEEMQRCQAAADKLKISRYKFIQSAVLEKAAQILAD
jgi:transposase